MLAQSIAAAVLVTVACGAAPEQARPQQADWDALRRRMVERQIQERGIASQRVLEAMRRVPRHRFVPEAVRSQSYEDHPLPIGFDQTISQPYIVGFMTDALQVEPDHRVLEIGTGSGYQAAILAELAREVYTLEIIPALAERGRSVLEDLGYRNVHVRAGNGYLGWPEAAPFDRIIVTAAPDEVPPALVAQLKIGGLMAIPVGGVEQELRILRRTGTSMETLATLPVRFVPMTGKPKR
jgi:protein-L-isoaspartate(D-aspartate) O-methyltransferase